MSEYGNVIHQEFGGEAAQARVVGNDLDPEKAQRAVELGEATGIEPHVVAQNLEEFDQYHKASLGAHIVRNNQALKQYIDSHPMAAAVSGDDLGQLDKITDSVKALAEEDDPMAKMHKIFWEGYGEGPMIGGWVMNNPNNFNEDGTLKHPYVTALASGLGAFLEVPMRAFGGALAVGQASISGVYTDVTGDESGGRRLARDFGGMADTYMNQFLAQSPKTRTWNAHNLKEIQKVALDQRAQMYWQSGKELPIGLSKEFDAAIDRVSKEYWKKIDDLASEADKSATKERNPEFFRTFVEQHPELEGATVRIDAEAIQRLYGEDLPSANDGLLGFIPNLDSILKVGADFGVPVRVPLIDWVTKLDKDLRDVLKDDARAKLQSVSKKEGEDLKVWNQIDAFKEEKPKEGEPVPSREDEAICSVRQSSGLEPQSKIFDNIKDERKYGAEKLKLARLDEAARKDLDINTGSKDAFDITDDKGNVVGTLQGQLNGTEYFVDWISSRGWAQSFGPKQVLQLVKELKAEYPNIKTISGNRVSGARSDTEKQGERVTFKAQVNPEAPGGWDIVEAGPVEGKWHEFAQTAEGEKLEGLVKPKELWTKHEQRIRDVVLGIIDKIGPKGQKRGVVHSLRSSEGGTQGGVFIDFAQTESLVLVALHTKDPKATAAHEAGHALKKSGAFSEAEWDILTERVLKGDGDKGTWLDQYDIKRRYADASKDTQIEEAVMHKFGDYVSGKWMPEAGPIREMFERLKEIVTQIRLGLKEVFGRELTAEDIFEKARTGGYKGRRPLTSKAEYIFKPGDAEVKAQRDKQLELPGTTRIEDQQVFEKASAAGMTVKQYRQYMKAIEDVRESDRQYQLEKAKAYERKKQTKEWKTEAEALEPKVTEELNALPDYRANEFFRTGVLDGEKLSKMPKLNPELIDLELVRGLPERYLSDKGMHPDDAAGLLGIESGSSLVEMLSNWKEAQGDVAPAKFVHDLIKGEVERRMSVKHGPLSENIIDAARDHVINNAQYELIHQEVLAAALRAGKDELPISKKEMEEYAKDQFRQAPVGNVSVEEMLREMGKAQRAAAMALLDGDPVAALKWEQKRMLTFIATREAKKLEVQQRIFDRNVKRFSEREVPNFPQEYTNFIHDIMMKLGAGKLNFTFADWQKRIAAESHANLWDFVSYKMNNDLLEIRFDDRLFDDSLRDPNGRPPLDNLTVQEFMNAHDFMRSLIKNGRDEYKVNREGEENERIAIKRSLIDQLDTFAPLNFDAKGGRWLGPIPPGPASLLRRYGVAHLQWESIANRIDRGNPNGPFSQYVMRPLIEGANYVGVLERKYAERLKTLNDKTKLNEKIPNNLFVEPTTLDLDPGQQRFMPMTRENLRKILLYWGSESGQKKLFEGYNVEPQKIQGWLDQHAKKEDYEWAKKFGGIWKELKDEIDVMYQNIAGAPPEDIKLAKLKSPHGDYDGWYHPLVPHPNVNMTRIGGAPDYANGLVQQNFFRATTANGHVMRRTGAVYALDLGLDSTASIMKRQIYDLAMRPGLIEASKFLRDRQVKDAITRHFGREYTEMIDPYLSDVANAMNNNDAAANAFMQVWNAFRSNVIGTMIGFNPGTVLKHGPTALVQSITEVGPVNFANAVRGLWQINKKTGEKNWNFAMSTSEELQRRHQNYLETLKGQNAQVLGKTTLREKMLSAGAYPVAISDLLSAVPTWMAQYEKTMTEGSSHGDAVYMADRAVRRAHGSTAVTNRPSVMRGGFGMSLLNPVYGFFSHILNRQYEMTWRANDLVQGTAKGQVSPKEFSAESGALAVMLVAYVVAPAIIEELVSPLPSKPDDGYGTKAAKMFGFGLGSSWIGVRDVAHFWAGGFSPTVGLTGPITQATRDMINDMSKGRAFDEDKIGPTLKHSLVAAGMLTGLTNAQMGRWAQLAYEYSIEKDVPDGFWQWLVALRFGQTKGHSKSPEEYVEHLTGEH